MIRLFGAIASSTLPSPRRRSTVGAFVADWLRAPVRYATQQTLSAIPETSLPELLPAGYESLVQLDLSRETLDRQSWNVRLDEELLLALTVRALGARRIFEIGTYNGRTTRRLAEAAGADAKVFTLDLPAERVDALFSGSFSGSRIGEVFRSTAAATRITQLHGDSLSFDFAPYYESIDLVFVDAAHDYPHGLADTRAAVRMIRPGGIIFWHDFTPDWPGLVAAIVEGTDGYPLRRLSGTSMAVLRAPSSGAVTPV